MKTDFKNCHLNLISSIEKRFGYNHEFESLSFIDDVIKDKKHVFLILLDGMGKNIIDRNLKEKSFIRKHVLSTMTAIYPPTTACVTNAVLSGKLPNETGWFGWHQYIKEHDKDVVIFQNREYYNGEKVDFNVKEEILPYDDFFDKYKDKGIDTYKLFPKFAPDGFKTFKAECKKMVEISKTENESFCYCYWTEPDTTMHVTGCDSILTKIKLRYLDRCLNNLAKDISNDSAFIVIADHGLIDTKFIYIDKYPEINKLLTKKPSIENRTTTFEVSDKELFKKLFNDNFSAYFDLYTKEEFLNSDYFYKTKENKVSEFLFDFVSVAKDKYGFAYGNKVKLIAHHAGATEDEMLVPVVVYTK